MRWNIHLPRRLDMRMNLSHTVGYETRNSQTLVLQHAGMLGTRTASIDSRSDETALFSRRKMGP